VPYRTGNIVRILSTRTTAQLAQIASQVYFHQQLQKLEQQQHRTTSSSNSSSGHENLRHPPSTVDTNSVLIDPQQQQQLLTAVQKKRDKWNQIPAFLVTLIASPSSSSSSPNIPEPNGGNSTLGPNTTTMEDVSDPAFSDVNDLDHGDGSSSSSSSSNPVLYEPVPFVPLTTERMVEDYASACAATQNILLSLHAEQMATKWVGPIIQHFINCSVSTLPLPPPPHVSWH
jgi:hypothetical protein